MYVISNELAFLSKYQEAKVLSFPFSCDGYT